MFGVATWLVALAAGSLLTQPDWRAYGWQSSSSSSTSTSTSTSSRFSSSSSDGSSSRRVIRGGSRRSSGSSCSSSRRRATVRLAAEPAAEVAGLPLITPITSVDHFATLLAQDETEVKVVKFVAKNCRGCLALKPKFESLAKAHMGDARFYEVNFEMARQVFGAEQVRRTPTVLYYCGPIGRVEGFAFGPTPAEGSMLRRDFDRVRAARAELAAVRPHALRPAQRYKALVGLLRAVVGARDRLEEECSSRGTSLDALQKGGALAEARAEAAAAAAAARAAAQGELVAEAAALFAWVDRERKGFLDAQALTVVAEALSGASAWGVTTGRVGAGGGSGLPTDPAELNSKLADGLAVAGGPNRTLDLDAFSNLWLLHRAHEKAKLKPEAEARAAFALIDADGSGGAVPMATAAATLAKMCVVLPLRPAGKEAPKMAPGEAAEEESAEAIERLLRTFDLEAKGHVHFECFARLVMRSSPSPWGE